MKYEKFRKLVKYTMFWFIRNNYGFIIALFYKVFVIKRRKSKNKSSNMNSERITILALNSRKFRGDLECLAQVSKYRVLILENMWEALLLQAFTPKKIWLVEYMNAKAGNDIYVLREKINIFFRGFVSSLLKLIRIDCVITANYRYVENYFWIKHFEEKGIPHICFYRECLTLTDRADDGLTAFHRRSKGYPVTHVIVHNQVNVDIFLKSGFVTESQINACGALRMDNFLKLINSSYKNTLIQYKARRKRVILFYFHYSLFIFGQEKLSGNDERSDNVHKYRYVLGIWPKRMALFSDLHTSFIHLAKKHPEVDFVVKPKRGEMSDQTSWDVYLKVVNESGIDLSKLKNYTIEPDANVHDLIINSDVVIGLHSSTMIEAAIAGKPVIFPLFYKYKETKKFNDFMWHKYLNLFDVAESADEFESLVVEKLENSVVDEKTMEGRRGLFKKIFSDLEGVALKRYVETIENVVNSAKSRN